MGHFLSSSRFGSLPVQGPAQVVWLGHRGTPSLDAATKLPFPRRPPHSISRSPLATESVRAAAKVAWSQAADLVEVASTRGPSCGAREYVSPSLSGVPIRTNGCPY